MTQSNFGKKIFRLDTVSSTQTCLKEQFKAGAEEGTVAVALEQSLGRGRLNRSWESPAGKGLWMSVLVEPDGPESMWGWVPLWAGVVARRAIVDTVQPETSTEDLKLRWPNDIYWQNRKLGGILAEAVSNGNRRAVILGYGINLLQSETDFAPHLRQSAVSVYQMTGNKYESEALLEKIIMALNLMVPLVKPIDAESVRNNWMKSAWALGEELKVVCSDNVFVGRFVGLGEHGEIGLEMKNQRVKYLPASDDIQKLMQP